MYLKNVRFFSVPTHGYQGTRFMTAFIGNSTLTPYLYTIAHVRTTITIEIPSENFNETSTISPGTSIRTFSQNLGTYSSRVSNKAVYVTTNNPVYFYTANTQYAAADATYVLPEPALGKEYQIIGHDSTTTGTEMFVVVSTASNTQVTVTLPSGASETVTLGLFETYIRNEAMLTGSFVTATENVAVISGHPCASIPKSDGDICQYIEEMLPPIQSYGTVFVLTYMSPRPHFIVGIVAAVDGTVVNIYKDTGTPNETITMSRGEYVKRSYINSNVKSLVSTEGILVVEYGVNGNDDSGDGGASMMLIPAIQNYAHEYSFEVFTGYGTSWLTLVIKDGTQSSVLLDNSAPTITSTFTVQVPGSGAYVVLYIDISSGNHKLTHAQNETFGAWLYARDSSLREYAMCLGLMT